MRNAIVAKPMTRQENGQMALSEQIRALASVEKSDADFVSCYLNLSDGLPACEAFIAQRAAEIRAQLPGAVRLDFECAVETISSRLRDLWAADVTARSDGVALFARGIGPNQQLSVVRVHRKLEPSFTLYPIPDLVQLATLDRNERVFTLVLGRRGELRVLDIQGDAVSSRAWVSYRVDRRSSGARSEIVLPERRFHVLRRTLAGDSSTPLVIAGDGNCLDDLTAALPARVAGRLRDVLRVPVQLDQQEAIAYIRRRVGRCLDRQGREVADRLLLILREDGLAVAGPVASFEALRAGAVEALVLEARDAEIETWRCADCGARRNEEADIPNCDLCGDAGMQAWRGHAELVRLAYREDVPLFFVSSARLRDLGGAGCLLQQPVEIEVMPRPVVGARALDLAA